MSGETIDLTIAEDPETAQRCVTYPHLCTQRLVSANHMHDHEWFSTNQQQRERKRRNSDRSEDGYHSDGDYPDQDYRREPGDDRKSKTIMLWGLSPHITEEDVSRLLFLSLYNTVQEGRITVNRKCMYFFFPSRSVLP